MEIALWIILLAAGISLYTIKRQWHPLNKYLSAEKRNEANSMEIRHSVGIVLLSSIWLPGFFLAWCAGIVWPIICSGFLWGICDSEGKTPEQMWGKRP